MRDRLQECIDKAMRDLGLDPQVPGARLERPANPNYGDWSSNVSLVAAKTVGRNPRDLAGELAAVISASPPPHLVNVEVAGAGFVNFHLEPGYLHEVLVDVVIQGERDYARSQLGKGERVQIEFVSANPTGPLHVGNGWWGAYGDSLARVMARCGYEVSREYYVNDTGGQIRRLGMSLLARLRGEPVPQEGYQGAYVAELAKSYEGPDDDVMTAGRWAAEIILENIKRTCQSMGIHFDEWYSQASIEESGAVAQTIAILAERNLVEEEGGATWLRSTKLGDSRDRVLIKSNGDPTYLAGDLAYHRDKFIVRGFDRVIDVFGADHHGQVASLLSGVRALGIDPDRLEVKLGQMVSLVDGQAAGKMSKRAGNFVPLDDLIADIGPDATRLLSLMSSVDQATTLDLDLVRQQSMDNPVYYVQYAHARIASIDRVAKERGLALAPLSQVNLSLLAHERELELLRCLDELPDVLVEACEARAPSKITTWVRALAGRFHGFYHDCPVLGSAGGEGVDPDLMQARWWLVEAVRIGLAIGLDLLGVRAPESM